MGKKIAILISILLIAVAILLSYLNNQFENRIIEFAEKQGVELSKENIETSFFSPNLKLKNIHCRVGNIELKNINIEIDNIKFDTDEMSISAEKNQVIFYFNNRPYHIFVGKLKLTQLDSQNYLINAQQSKVNQSSIFDIQGDLNKSQLTFYIQNNEYNAKGKLTIQQSENTIDINGSNIIANLIQGILNIPILIDGKSDFNVHIQKSNRGDYEGIFTIITKNGVINNLNLLDIIGQYLPINWNENKSSKKYATPFDLIESQITFNNNKINMLKNRIIAKDIIASGKGEMKLDTMQCNFILNLQSRDERYKNLIIPMHFYGDCRYPQYNVKFDDFRTQLKDMIKDRLLH